MAIGARLAVRGKGRGNELAKLLWFTILSHASWSDRRKPTWPSNGRLAECMGLAAPDPEPGDSDPPKFRDVERALARLREADMVRVEYGNRPKATHKPMGRILRTPGVGPTKVLIPLPTAMVELRRVCSARDRPASLVTLAVGAYVFAAHGAGRHPIGWTVIPGTLADLRRLVGARKGHAFTARMRDLERLGLVRTVDGERLLAPVSEWYQHARAMKRATCSPIAVESIPY